MRRGTQAYGVVCIATDLEAPGHTTIKAFDTQTLLRFGRLIDQGGPIYAVVAGTVAPDVVRSRIHLPTGITADDVRGALQRLSQGEPHPFGVSTGWEVAYRHAAYPQKAVLGLAAQRLAARPLGPYDFKAGECRCILTRLGFPPVPKGEQAQPRDDADDAAETEFGNAWASGRPRKQA